MVAPVIIGGALAGLGSIGGALLGGSAQESAAEKQAAMQRWIFNQQTKLNQPYMYAGNAALNPLFSLYGINAGLSTGSGSDAGPVGAATPAQQQAALDLFYTSPEYTIQKGMLDQALQRQAAATGTLYSPSTALGQAEIAGRTFGDWRNNLASLAQMGPNAANQQSSNLTNFGSGMDAAYANMGNASANMATALGGTLGQIGGMVNQYGQYQDQMRQQQELLGKLFQPQQNVISGGGIDWSQPIPDYTATPALSGYKF